MSAPASWRKLLRDIISDPLARERIASAMGVHPMTLNRWVSSESKPRSLNLRRLLSTLPHEQRNLMAELLEQEQLLEQEHIDSSDSLPVDSLEGIESTFVMQVLELRETTAETLLFWTLCNKVFQHALRQLDPERMGLAIRLVLCMTPHEGKIYSLRESVGLGTAPWRTDLEPEAIFLGAESLAGYATTSCRIESIQNLAAETIWVPVHRAEYEKSAVAAPLLYANRVAGCLLVSSTQPDYFRSSSRLSLISDYARLLGLALKPEQFYPPEWLELRMMPSVEVQRVHLASFWGRVIELMKQAFNTEQPLTRQQAEQLVWQQLEEELIEISSRPN